MARGKKDKVTITVHVINQQFTIQEDRQAGQWECFYQRFRNGTPGNMIHVWFPLSSCWIDPLSNKVLRAHLLLTRNLTQMRFYQDILRLREISSPERQTFQASASSSQRVIYYGPEGEATFNRYDRETGNNYHYFNSKALALRGILKNIQDYRAIGGLNFANLNSVSDDVLRSVGFEPIEDIMGVGPPMWRGNPEVLSAMSYRDKERRESADFFLTLLDDELKLEKEVAA